MFRAMCAVTMLFAMLLPGGALATAQVADRIQIDGEAHLLHTNPLASYLRERNWKPPRDAMWSTANWRGYVAHWEISGGQLVLKDVTVRIAVGESREDVEKSILPTLFPASQRVVASWYSGALVVPEGQVKNYVHMGYGSTFERYQVLRVASGRVVEHLHLSAEAFEAYRAEKFRMFTGTGAYREMLERLRNSGDGRTEADARDFIRDFAAEEYLAL